jgi:hypothetical protein
MQFQVLGVEFGSCMREDIVEEWVVQENNLDLKTKIATANKC